MNEYKEIKIIKEVEREYQEIIEPEKIGYLLKEYLGNQKMTLKEVMPALSVTLIQIIDKQNVVFEFPLNYKIPNDFTLYTTLNKQMEVECQVQRTREGNQAEVLINKIKIAAKGRTEQRLYLNDTIAVANEFYISKNKIDLNPLTSSVSNKVLFDEYNRKIKSQDPEISILDFSPSNKNFEAKLIKKHHKGILITDVTNEESYKNIDDRFLNLVDILKTDLETIKHDFLNKNIKSLLAYPIYYENLKREKFPIGYIRLESKEKHYTIDDYESQKKIAETLLSRVKDANTILLDIRQEILNISLTGMLIKVDDNEFKTLLQNRDDLSFSVTFKLQAPLRFYGAIKHIRQDSEKNFLVGIHFAGEVYDEFHKSNLKEKLKQNMMFAIKQGSVLSE